MRLIQKLLLLNFDIQIVEFNILINVNAIIFRTCYSNSSIRGIVTGFSFFS